MGEAVGREVRRLREAKGWGQAKLAVEAGMSVSGVSQIENGKRNLSTATLDKLAKALGVEVADLFPKAEAPLPFLEQPEGEASAERRALTCVRPWFEAMDDLSKHYEDLASPNGFDAGEYRATNWFVATIMGGLNKQLSELRSQGIDPLDYSPISEQLDESMLRLAWAQRASDEAARRVLTEDELARIRRRRAEWEGDSEELARRVAEQ